MCVSVVLGCWQVLVSSDGAKSAKLANICVEWLHRVVGVLGKLYRFKQHLKTFLFNAVYASDELFLY